MADPMTTLTGAMSGYTALVDKVNVNLGKRHWLDQRLTANVNVTLVDSDEFVRCSATSAARSCVLPAAASYAGREIRFLVIASDVTNTFTFTPSGADTVDGGASVVVNSNRQKLAFFSDGVSDWIRYDLT